MDALLTDEEKAIKDQARFFAEKEILPHRARLRKKEFPWDIFRKMAENGYTGAAIPEQYGGAGLKVFPFGLITEELCRADGGVGLSIGASQSLVAKPIEFFGTQEQKEYWLTKIAVGDVIGAYAQTEPNAGSDVSGVKTRGTFEGDQIIINGSKQFITNGSIANLILAIIRTDSNDRWGGLSMVLIDANKAGAEGTLKVVRDEDKLGLHCSPTTALSFENCKVPASNILGAPGMGFLMAMATLACSRIMIADQAVGLAQGALDCALEYSVSREQFGKKIAEFQAIQNDLAQMATTVAAMRSLTYNTARLIDKKLEESGVGAVQEFMAQASMAKLFTSEAAQRVAQMSLDIHGGVGYMLDSRISGIVADTKVLTIYEGTSNIQKLIIARDLLHSSGVKIKF